MKPNIAASQRARFFAWCDRLARVRTKLASLTRNARYIEQLMRAPKTIGPDAAASLVHTVNLVIEARCNIRCDCCHYFATRDDVSLAPPVDLSRMLERVDEVPQAIIGITGGEPLMSPARVVEVAQALLRRNRALALATNSLPLADPRRSALARGVLLEGLSLADRARLRVLCSVDLQHLAASRLPPEDYVNRCHAAIRFLATAGFPVFTRSIVTSREDYLFFKTQVLPLRETGVTLGAAVQPDIYDLPRFASAFRRQELGDIGDRLGSHYLHRIIDEAESGAQQAAHAGVLRTAPWALVEINSRGVRGPSGFVAGGAHHGSVLEMLRSYDWLAIADSIVPQITISQNAFLFTIDRERRAVGLNFPYIVSKIMRRRTRIA